MADHDPSQPLIRTKPRPNDSRYVEILRRMTPEQRLLKAFELTEFSRSLFISGLRTRHPHLAEPEFRRLVVEKLKECHSKPS